ncbi:hypothetical protein [Hyphomonas chukchiensis]|uniref:hypothetical protein n=1 Tax=Hyphomonas chukchiensis TaxID=1280947 RepID=UPI0030F63DFC
MDALPIVNEHSSQSKSAFAKAITQAASASDNEIDKVEISEFAEHLVTSSRDFRSYGKSIHDVGAL